MEPIQDDRPRNFMEEGTWNMSNREPIQDDIETALIEQAMYPCRCRGDAKCPGHQALDRLVAERDRLLAGIQVMDERGDR